MNGVVTILLQPLNYPLVDAHIRQESHRLLGCLNLFLGEPRRILDCLLDIFALQVRISLKNLLETGAVSDLSDDHGNWNAHPTDTRSAAHDIGIESDSVEHTNPPGSIYHWAISCEAALASLVP